MATAHEDISFSEFLHRPAAAAARLDHVRSLRLRRRGEDDLTLLRADQAENDRSVVDFTARLLAGLVRVTSLESVRQALPDALPWVRFLPDADVDELLRELVDTVHGAASLDNLNPVSTLLTQWRHTAEVYADPSLLALVTHEPEGDLGQATAPAAA